MSGRRDAKVKSLISLALILTIVPSAFIALSSSIGSLKTFVAAAASEATYYLHTVDYAVPGICSYQVCDLRVTFESGDPYTIRVQGTIKFSASSWNVDPRVAMVNVGLVASIVDEETLPYYYAQWSGGDEPSWHDTDSSLFSLLWHGCTSRDVTLGTMWTQIHPNARGVELGTTWTFYESDGNEQQKIFDYTLWWDGVSMTRVFIAVGVMDWYDFTSGLIERALHDGLMMFFTKALPLPEGVSGVIRLIEAVADLIKTAEGTPPEDRGNIDAVWTVPIGESVDAEGLDWMAGGDDVPQRTTIDGEFVFDGDAIRLGDFDFKDLENNEEIWISTAVTGTGEISFHWKVSSEHNYDYLRFYIDSTEMAKISGSIDWQFRSFTVSGTHTLKWVYTKDFSVSSGSDCGWVDKVTWRLRSGGGGGCPYVYAWNGQGYVMDNNLLPASEISNGDVEDYYRLEQALVPIYQGKLRSVYSLQIREFEHEHDYFDQVKLLAVDHDSDVNIAITPDGEILTYREPQAPISCVDRYEEKRLSQILQMDGNISDPTTYYYGETGDYLVLNFGHVGSEDAKLILRDDMKSMVICIHVQIKNNTGEWETVATVTPRDYWATEAVDLSKYVIEKEDFLVRLYWTSPHRLDYVGLDTGPQANLQVDSAKLIWAVHSTHGDVKPRLIRNDQTYAELVPGELIQLTFLLPNNRNQERTFILYTEGHYNTIQ